MEARPPLGRRTFASLWEDARTRRWVKWYPSGAVERLRITLSGKAVMASGPFIEDHFIASYKHTDRTYNYEVVNPGILFTLRELKRSAKKTRFYKSWKKLWKAALARWKKVGSS